MSNRTQRHNRSSSTVVKALDSDELTQGAPMIPSTETMKPIEWEVWAKKATTARDLVLVGVSIVYIMGFLIWSWNAWVNHLGLMPVVQAQYVAAGLIPVAFILYAIATATIFARREKPILDHGQRVKHVFKIFGLGVFYTASVCLWCWLYYKHRPSELLVAATIASIVGSTFYGRTLGVVWIHLTEDMGLRFRIMAIQTLICFAVACVYAKFAYPVLPQEFGGVKPRCAYLDVKRLDISPYLRTVLFTPGDQVSNTKYDPSKDPNPVVRTVPVDVLYDNGDAVELRPHSATDGAIYEIKRSNIVSITWYGYEFPKHALKPIAASTPPIKLTPLAGTSQIPVSARTVSHSP